MGCILLVLMLKPSELVDDEMTRLRDKLLQTVPPLQCPPCTSHVTIALLNVRSIVAKLVDIKADAELMSANVLCFCETWLSPAQSSPMIYTGHKVLRCDRQMNNHMGGTMISIPHSIENTQEVTFFSYDIECIVTVLSINAKRFQVAVIYRSPGLSRGDFIQFMCKLVQHLRMNNLPTVVLGDMTLKI